MIHNLASGVSANGNGTEVHTNRYNVSEGVFQVQITGTAATVKLQGRMDNISAPWTDVDSFTASGAKIVALFPFMRVNVSGVTAATVDAWLSESGK
jgi:hypothetical protein